MVSLSSLLGRVRVRTARVRVKRDEGGEDGARARVFRSFRSFRSSSHWDDGQVIQSGPRSPHEWTGTQPYAMGGLGGGLRTPTSTPKRCPGGGTDLSRYPTLLPYMVYERVDRTPTLPGNFRGPYKSQNMGANEANQVINVASALEFSSAQRLALAFLNISYTVLQFRRPRYICNNSFNLTL